MSESKIIIVSHYDSSMNNDKPQNSSFSAEAPQATLSWFQVYTTGVWTLIHYYRESFVVLIRSFPSDLIMSSTYKYPFLGLKEYIFNIKIYWKYVTPLFFLYFLTTTVVAFYYLLIVFPILLANLTLIFGIFGIVISVIQAVLEINAISLVIGRMMIFDVHMETFFETVLENHGKKQFLIEYKKQLLQQQIMVKSTVEDSQKKAVKPSNSFIKIWSKKIMHLIIPVNFSIIKKTWLKKNDKDYWLNEAFFEIGFFLHSFFKIIFLLLLSNVPVIGPIIVMILSSSMRTLSYMNIYFKMSHYNNVSVRKLVHKHYGQFVGFGVVASLFESLPYLSLFGAMVNQAGAALWAIDLINKQQMQNQMDIENINTKKQYIQKEDNLDQSKNKELSVQQN